MKGKSPKDAKGPTSKLKKLNTASPRSDGSENNSPRPESRRRLQSSRLRSWTVEGWLAHIGVPDLIGSALVPGKSSEALDAIRALGEMPNSSAVLDLLKDEALLSSLADRIWESAKTAKKGNSIQGASYDALLARAASAPKGNRGGHTNDAEKLPEALREFPPLAEEEDIAQHIDTLRDLEAAVLKTNASPESLQALALEVQKVCSVYRAGLGWRVWVEIG